MFLPAFSLATVGTLITAVIVGFGGEPAVRPQPARGPALGAIVASTDGAAIFAVLRGSTLRRRLARTLEGEAGINDPVAVLLVLGLHLLDPAAGLRRAGHAGRDRRGAASSAARSASRSGWCARPDAAAACASRPPACTRSRRSAFAALAFGGRRHRCTAPASSPSTSPAWCSAARATPARRTITTFHDGLAWVAQLGMFLVLGLLVFPSDFGGVWLEGIVLALVLVFVARPVATFAGTARAGLLVAASASRSGGRACAAPCRSSWRRSRSSRASPRPREFFDIVFFAVLVSTLLQGTTFEWLVGAARGHDERGGHPDAVHRPDDRSAGSARRSPSSRSGPATPSPGASCASSACRARRCST